MSPVVLYVPENQKAFEELKSKSGQLMPYYFVSRRVFATSFMGEKDLKLDHVFLTVEPQEIQLSGANAEGVLSASFHSATALWSLDTLHS